MKSIRTGAGYLLSDDRASGGKLQEADVLTCAHCQKLLLGDSWREDGGFCGRCCAPVCGRCADRMLTDGCTPFAKLIDRHVSHVEHHRDEFVAMLGTSGVPES